MDHVFSQTAIPNVSETDSRFRLEHFHGSEVSHAFSIWFVSYRKLHIVMLEDKGYRVLRSGGAT